jgi:tellurite resistance protein TehA-like permease
LLVDVRRFGPEWFGVVLGTLAVSMNSLRLSVLCDCLRYVGWLFFYLGLLALVVLGSLWTIRLFFNPSVVKEDFLNVIRLSFVPVLPLSITVLLTINYLYDFVSFPEPLYYWLYYAIYVSQFVASIALGVRLLLLDVDPNSITYAILIPPVSVLSTSFLGIPLREYFLTAIATGVGVLLFLFLGSVALTLHVREAKTLARLSSSIMPAGVSSIVALSLLGLAGGGLLSASSARLIGLTLVGFETWNFFVTLVVAGASFHRLRREPLLLWALTFPVSVYSSASLGLYYVYRQPLFLWLSFMAYATLLVFWVTAVTLTAVSLSGKGPKPQGG